MNPRKGERSLANEPVTVWVYDGSLKVEYHAVALSKYTVELQDDRKHLRAVSHPRLAQTPFHSPQLTLFDLGPDEWLLYWRTPEYAPRTRRRVAANVTQLVLFEVPEDRAKAAGAETVAPALRLIIAPKEVQQE